MSDELPEGWIEVPLRDLLREPLRNGHSAKASPDGSGVRTLTLIVSYGGAGTYGEARARLLGDAVKRIVGLGDGGAEEGRRPRRVPHRILTKREVNAEQYRIGIGGRHGSRQLVVDQPIEVGLDHDVRDDKRLAPVADHQSPLDQLPEGLEGVGVLPAPPVAGDVETRAMAGQLCGPVGDALEPAHLVARLRRR